MSKRNRLFSRFARCSAVGLAAASASTSLVNSAFGAGATWTLNSTGNWSTSSAWSTLQPADGAGEIAGFGLGANPLDTISVTLDSNRTIGALAFADTDASNSPAGWRILQTGASVLTLQTLDPSIVPTINVTTLGGASTSIAPSLFQQVAIINAPIAGTQGFTKQNTGTLVLTRNNSGLSGAVTNEQGTLILADPGAIGTSTLTIYTGNVAFRNDTSSNFNTKITLLNDTTIGVGNALKADGTYGSLGNLTHTINSITLNQLGQRRITVSGSNGVGLTMGTLALNEGVRLLNVGSAGSITTTGDTNGINGLGSGLLTVGTVSYAGGVGGTVNGTIEFGGSGSLAGNITVTNTITQAGSGAAAIAYTGDKTLTLTNGMSTTGNVSVTGNGTMIVGTGTLPSGNNLLVSGGSLLLNASGATHSIGSLAMGGATISSGPVVSYISTNAGTVTLGGNVTMDAGANTNGSVATTTGTINSNLNLGAALRSIAVNGGSTSLAVNGVVAGTGGGINKTGTGTLSLLNANTFSGNLTVTDGTLLGKAQASGNPFSSANATVGGAVELIGRGVPATAGTGTLGTTTFTDTGANTGLIVDATGSGVTTLQIGTFGGRAGGTHGTIKIVPVTGSLNTNEVIHINNTAPTSTNGILPAYMAVQTSGTDTTLGFADISSGNLIAYGGYATGGIGGAASTAVYRATSNETAGSQTLFGLRVDNGSAIGGGSLQLGNGGSGFGGLILNSSASAGAAMNASTLTFGTDEGVIWSGGATKNTIASNINLNGDLTTGGSQQMDVTGTIGFNGSPRNLTVTGNQVNLIANGAISGSSGFTKRGGGILALGASNTGYSGTTTVTNGTLQIGIGATGDIGTSAIVNNANVVLARTNSATFSNTISGAGDLYLAGTTSGIQTLAGSLSYTGKTVVQSGTVRMTATNRIPSATLTDLVINGGATFDLTGFGQTVNGLTGSGAITNSGASAVAIVASQGTYSGNILNGTGTTGLIKNGSGLLVLNGSGSNFGGTVNVNDGILQIDNGNALAATSGTNGTINLTNATLVLNNTTNRNINRPLNISGTSTISVTANPNPQVGATFDGAGVSITGTGMTGGNANTTGGWSGTGTLILDLRGRQLDVGTNNVGNPGTSSPFTASQTLAGFSGTMTFSDSNPVGSRLRMAMGVNQFVTGNNAATFNFGNGFNNINFRNGTVAFNMGWVSGGTHTILEGNEAGSARTTYYTFGAIAGDQTFAGTVRDLILPGQLGLAGINKIGAASSLTLTGVHTYSLATVVSAGTMIMGAGGDIQGSSTINVGSTPNRYPTVANNNATLEFGGGTITGNTFINLLTPVNNATQSISGNLKVPNGFTTPAGVTYMGGGSIFGNLNHNAGSISPGTVGGINTLTFNDTLNLNGGNLSFDVSTSTLNPLNGGTNDTIKVLPSSGLSLNGGIIRLNFVGDGSAALQAGVGQYFPLMNYTGSIGGTGTSSMTTVALFHGGFTLVQGTGTFANTIGARVDSLGGTPVNLTWNPTNPNFNGWDIVGTQNWKPTGGAGALFYFNTDRVTFDDSTTIRTVDLGATTLAPTSITVTTNNTYSFVGNGTITGSTNLVKNGTGTLNIQTSNNFTGGVTANGGFLSQDRPTGGAYNAFGTSTIALNGTSGIGFTAPSANSDQAPSAGTLVVNGNNTLVVPSNSRPQNLGWSFLGNGTLTVNKANLGIIGSNTLILRGSMSSFTGKIVLPQNPVAPLQISDEATGSSTGNFGSPSATFDLGNNVSTLSLGTSGRTYDFGALIGGVDTRISGQEYNNTATNGAVTANNTATISIGAKNTVDSAFDGRIFDAISGTANTNVIKTGTLSTLTMTQLQPYTGTTIVNQGTLALSNPSATNLLTSPLVTVNNGGFLDVGGLNGGSGIALNANQVLITNGDVVGGAVEVTASSTLGGSKASQVILDTDGTISPGLTGSNSIGTFEAGAMSVGNGHWLIESDSSGVDSVKVDDGGLDFSGPVIVDLVNLGGFTPTGSGDYTLLDYGSNFSPGTGGFILSPFSYTITLNDTGTSIVMHVINNSAQWNVNSGGSWSTGSNWTGGIVPNAVVFGSVITAPKTVTVSSLGNTANSVVFDNINTYTIDGTGTLTLDSAGSVPVTVAQGNHQILTPVRILRNMAVSVASSSTLSFGGTITNANSAPITKSGNGTVSFTRLNMNTGSLIVNGGMAVLTHKAVANTVDGTSIVRGITVAPGATLNLNNNSTIIDYTGGIGTTLSDLRAELADGRIFSADANNLVGAGGTRLGYRNNDTGTTAAGGTGTAGLGLGQNTTFAGVGADTSSILIRVTYSGDTNLDGQVDVNDLYNMAINWLSTNGVWAGGDFNYDGIVNGSDLALLSLNWQLGVGSPLPSDSIQDALSSVGLPLSLIPEPTSLALAGLGAASLLGRRRRRA